jgi:hypothetical protein
MRAYSPSEILKKQYETLQWNDQLTEAFSNPETSGVWLVWGNSGNGKTNFMLQVAAALAQSMKVFYNSLEEGAGLTMQNTIRRTDLNGTEGNLQFGRESLAQLEKRLGKRRAPQVIIIDSFQHAQLTYGQYLAFCERHSKCLLIFVSHASGKQPSGRTASSVKYDADLKIWVEGFRAISHGRYNPGGTYTIWEDGAQKYWGEQ